MIAKRSSREIIPARSDRQIVAQPPRQSTRGAYSRLLSGTNNSAVITP
jgi:hypothetical protein